MGFDSECDFTPPTILLGLPPLPLDVGYLLKVAPAAQLPLEHSPRILHKLISIEWNQDDRQD